MIGLGCLKNIVSFVWSHGSFKKELIIIKLSQNHRRRMAKVVARIAKTDIELTVGAAAIPCSCS